MRRLLMIAAGVVALMVGAGAQPALADCTYPGGNFTGSWHITYQTSIGTPVEIDVSWQVPYCDDVWPACYPRLNMKVQTHQLPTNTCIDLKFDWQTTSGRHHDARVVRNCNEGAILDANNPFNEGHDPANWFRGMRELVVYQYSCGHTGCGSDSVRRHPAMDQSCDGGELHLGPPNGADYARIWYEGPNGVEQLFSGGDFWSASSKRHVPTQLI